MRLKRVGGLYRSSLQVQVWCSSGEFGGGLGQLSGHLRGGRGQPAEVATGRTSNSEQGIIRLNIP